MLRGRERTDWLVSVVAVAMCVAGIAVPLVIWISHDTEHLWALAVAGPLGLALLIVVYMLVYRAREPSTPPYLDDWGRQPPVCVWRTWRRRRKDRES